jgi:hypothetical protein
MAKDGQARGFNAEMDMLFYDKKIVTEHEAHHP